MSLKNYSHDEIAEQSMIELAKMILTEKNKAMDFREIYEEIAKLKGFTEEQKEENIAQFYTDLNTNGSFLTIGSNLWGLKRWYPVEQIEEEINTVPKKKKKKKATKRKKEEVFDEVEDQDLDEEELEFDDEDLLDDFDDTDDDDDVEDFDDFDDTDDDDDYDADSDDEEDLDLDDDEDSDDFDDDDLEEDDEEEDK